MFTHQHHLRHLLRPEHYTSEEQYCAELRHLFHPAWHPLAVKADLAKPGDFLTFDLLETPILIRNFDGELRAFLNVCPHRHSKLTEKPRGNAERLRCQYHGWEYNADGHTGKIPDAKAARALIERHTKEADAKGRVLFYQFVLPRPYRFQYPTAKQKNQYAKWFAGAANSLEEKVK